MTGSLNYFGLYVTNSSHPSLFWFLCQLINNHSKTGLDKVTWTWGRNRVFYNFPLNWTHSIKGRSSSNCISSILGAGQIWWFFLHGEAILEVSILYLHTCKKRKKSLVRKCSRTFSPNSQLRLSTTFQGHKRGWRVERRAETFHNIAKRLKMLYDGVREKCGDGKRIPFPQLPIPFSGDKKNSLSHCETGIHLGPINHGSSWVTQGKNMDVSGSPLWMWQFLEKMARQISW